MMSADRNRKQLANDDFLPLNPKKLAKNVEEEKSSSPAPVHKPNFAKKKEIHANINNLEERNA